MAKITKVMMTQFRKYLHGDLKLPNAEEEKIKVRLAVAINQILKQKGSVKGRPRNS